MIRRACTLLPRYSLMFLILAVIGMPSLGPIWDLMTVAMGSLIQAYLEPRIDRWFTS